MKLLVVGCGSMGRRHAENAGQYAEIAVCDQDGAIASALAEKINAQPFEDLTKALAWQPDAVVVSTPHDAHVSVAMQALQAGAHVLVEKPISNTPDAVAALIQQARTAQKNLYVVCNMRFHSAVSLLKENLAKIGRPLFARAHYGNYLPNMRPGTDYRTLYALKRSAGGGVILDAIHEVDYLRWFFGAVDGVLSEAAKLTDWESDVEDYAAFVLRHQNGVRSEIHVDYLQHYKRRGCEIVGEAGTLIWQSEGKHPEVCTVKLFQKETGVWETLYQCDNEDLNKPYQVLMQQFVNGLDKTSSVLASAEEGLAALQIGLAALASADQGSAVLL